MTDQQLETLWSEFVRVVSVDAGVVESKNFLGSVEKHKVLFLEAAENLKEHEV